MSAYRDACSRCDELEEQMRANANLFLQAQDKLEEELKKVKKERTKFLVDWGFFILLIAAAAVVTALLVYVSVLTAREPVLAEPCQDSAEIITSKNTARYCPAGSEMTAQALEQNQVLVRCWCKVNENE